MLKRVLCTCAALLVLSALPILAQEAAPSTPADQGPNVGGAQGALDDPTAGLGADRDTTLSRVQQENAARTEPPSVQGPKPNPVPGENEMGQQGGVADAQGQAVGQDQGEQPPGAAVTGDVDAQAEAGGGVTERAAVDTEAEADDDLGGAMPTTASPLPLVLAGGALLMGLGAGLAGFRRD